MKHLFSRNGHLVSSGGHLARCLCQCNPSKQYYMRIQVESCSYIFYSDHDCNYIPTPQHWDCGFDETFGPMVYRGESYNGCHWNENPAIFPTYQRFVTLNDNGSWSFSSTMIIVGDETPVAPFCPCNRPGNVNKIFKARVIFSNGASGLTNFDCASSNVYVINSIVDNIFLQLNTSTDGGATWNGWITVTPPPGVHQGCGGLVLIPDSVVGTVTIFPL